MKNLLVITYYWPPSGGAGVQRWLKFVKYLRLYGWEPVIYTPENPEYPALDESLAKEVPKDLTIIRTRIIEPYSAYKRFIGRNKEEAISAGFLTEKKKPGATEKIAVWIRGNLFIPDARKFWIRPSVRFLSSWLQDHPVDAMASTGPPHSCHLIALGLKRKLGIPWVADFRDPWTDIDFYRDLKLTSFADKKHRRLEKEVLTAADEVIMISKTQAARFRDILDRNYQVITNGYDEEDYRVTGTVALDTGFSLAHIGSLVPARNPHKLWEALAQLTTEIPSLKDDLEIKLVGKVDYSVIDAIHKYGLQSNLNKIDYLSHAEVVKVQFRSQVLLLLINDTPNAMGILTGKFFEYLAASRPILCIGPPEGDAAAILRQTGAGYTIDYQDIEAMKQRIRELYERFRSGDLQINSRDILPYSRRELTRKLAEVLDGAVGSQ